MVENHSLTCELSSNMKYILVVLAALAPLTAAASLGEQKPEANAFVKSLRELHRGPPVEPLKTRAKVEERWITQKLDNFDDSNNATWQDVRIGSKGT